MTKLSSVIIVLCVLGFVCSCKSIGYHVEGVSHIVRHDTITVKAVSDKPLTTDKFVDLK